MAFAVFISHSTKDLDIVYDFASHLKLSGMTAHVSEWYGQPGKSLPQKVAHLIESSDCMLALLTIDGARSKWVNQEIGYAHGKSRLIVPIVEEGVKVTGFLEGLEYIPFRKREPSEAISKVVEYLRGLATQKEQAAILAGIIILLFGLLALAAMASGKGK